MPRCGKTFLSFSVAFCACVVTARMSLGSGFIGGATGGLGAVNVTGTPLVGQTVKATSPTTATWQDSITAPVSITNTANDTSTTLSVSKIPVSGEQTSGSPLHVTVGSLCDDPAVLVTGSGTNTCIISADTGQTLSFAGDRNTGARLDLSSASLKWQSNGKSFFSRGDGTLLAQNATTGFFYLPRCATGAPSGTPGALTGAAACVVGGDGFLWAELVSGSFSRADDVVAQANISGQTAAATIVSYANANPATDADFEVGCQLNASAATSLSAPFQCTYTDVNNVAKTLTFAVQDVDGTGGTFMANGLMVAAAAKTFMTPSMRIRAKASTTITLKVGTGTFTSVTYSASGTIRKTS